MNATKDVNKINISYNDVIFAVFEKINLNECVEYVNYQPQLYGRTNFVLFNGVNISGKILLKFSLFLNIGNFTCDIIVANLEAIDILTQFFVDCFLEKNRRSCSNVLKRGNLFVIFKINGISQCTYTAKRTEFIL